ncbi:GIY-YIG nuclease family protein [Marivirga arenosa]|uniref:GIY-YIG nuclease family protein n=1 Tax=Marivirga arenosa TaxID=3059076 RepID=A0AA49GEU7_9BACT|nr:GIY-YIG nuclease family protein [Marivirga sp. BKB1-2]WKK82990.1 GIY-YIG nuclease family protein [Marivirga sp. BKB1-2]
MSTFFVYILFSSKINKFYIGYSQNPEKRLEFHNSTLNKIWSKRGQPWELKTTIPFKSKTEALKAERKIKKLKSKAIIKDIIENGWKH